MESVSRLQWTINTAGRRFSGTDSLVTVRVFRDGSELVYASVEPGNTVRLNRGRTETFEWRFRPPAIDVRPPSTNQNPPFGQIFPDGVSGHLRCEFEIHGDNMWRVLDISSRVFRWEQEFEPGDIDPGPWIETPRSFNFPGDDKMSSDSSEGVRRLNLNY